MPATPSTGDLHLVTPVYLIVKIVVAKDLVFSHLHVYTCLKPLP